MASRLRTIQEPTPQAAASFGSAVAGLGLVDGDQMPTWSRRRRSVRSATSPVLAACTRSQGKDGGLLWSVEGAAPGTRLGHALVQASDWDGDGVSDVAVGSPGDAFRGRRGAGQRADSLGRRWQRASALRRMARPRDPSVWSPDRGFDGVPEVISVAGNGASSRSLGARCVAWSRAICPSPSSTAARPLHPEA